MADQRRWFKLWCSAPSDDDLQALSPALRWAWAAVGCYTKEHGTKGTVKVSPTNHVLAAQMGVKAEELLHTIKLLPHVHVDAPKSDNGEFTVTWENWTKYQEDSTVYDRVKRFRARQHDNGLRREENKKRNPPISPKGDESTGDGFREFWNAYPKKRSKGQAEKAWRKLNPNDELVGIILGAIERAKKTTDWQKDDGQFIPYPTTWLNAKGWEDEIREPKQHGLREMPP